MRTFVVGDIHGRCAQLLNLLDMLPRDPENDTLVFLGDLIDRGAGLNTGNGSKPNGSPYAQGRPVGVRPNVNR